MGLRLLLAHTSCRESPLGPEYDRGRAPLRPIRGADRDRCRS